MDIGKGRLAMSFEILKYGTLWTYYGDNDIVVTLQPFIAHESVGDKLAVGIMVESKADNEWSVQGIRCDPVEVLEIFRLLEQATFCFVDGDELGVVAADGTGVQGDIDYIVNRLAEEYGKPSLLNEDVWDVYDSIPSDRLRLELFQHVSSSSGDSAQYGSLEGHQLSGFGGLGGNSETTSC